MSQGFELSRDDWDDHVHCGEEGTHIGLAREDFDGRALDEAYQVLVANGAEVVDGAIRYSAKGRFGELAVRSVPVEAEDALRGLGFTGVSLLLAA